MRRSLVWPVVLGGAALLSACTTPMFTMPPGAPEYRAGFYDGCDDGYAYAGSPFYQEVSAVTPRANDPYYAGWQAGFDRCRGSYQRIQKTISSVFGPPL